MIAKLLAWRFSKFAVVGGLGTAVNMACLWFVVQFWFAGQAKGGSLIVAQLAAIAVATVHNFALNRLWTWKDRANAQRDWRSDFLRYGCVAGLSIGLQLLCVALLREYVHYLFAAAIGIALASVAAFLLNDRWSFRPMPLDSVPGLRLDDALRTVGACALALLAYLYAIDSSLIPKNGDENVYLHITRVTGSERAIPGVLTASGWLPLKSELNNMRNTKPPLLFFQARAAAEISKKWDIAVLRLPSLLYTFATAFLIVAIARTLGQGYGLGIAAAVLWLAFFSTFRFGRPFLTTAPETFWLLASLLIVLRAPLATRVWRSALPWMLGCGFALGIALLHKSFALAAPAGVALGLVLAYRHWANGVDAKLALWRAGWFQAVAVGLSLLLFSLWFVFDPEPAAVWREFVVGENLGKMGHERSWISGFLSGGESVWAYLLSVLLNAGPLVLVAAAAWYWALKAALVPSAAHSGGVLQRLAAAWRGAPEQAVLWLWLGVWLVVFMLPSQRSARYILPAMPALALLLAMHWQRLPAWLLRVNHVLLMGLLAAAAALAGVVQQVTDPLLRFNTVALAFAALGLSIAAHGLLRPKSWALALPSAAFACYLAFAAAFRPLDVDAFSPLAAKRLAGQEVAVPCNFRAKFEEYRFLLPRSQILGVHESLNAKATALSRNYPAFVIRTRMNAAPPLCRDCEIMGSRWVFRSRHSSEEIKAMLGGAWGEQLLAREWLVQVKRAPGETPPQQDAALQRALESPDMRCL